MSTGVPVENPVAPYTQKKVFQLCLPTPSSSQDASDRREGLHRLNHLKNSWCKVIVIVNPRLFPILINIKTLTDEIGAQLTKERRKESQIRKEIIPQRQCTHDI